jgi:hypothetical protein
MHGHAAELRTGVLDFAGMRARPQVQADGLGAAHLCAFSKPACPADCDDLHRLGAVAIVRINMHVSDVPGAINHERPRHGKYPPAIGVPLREIYAGAGQHVFGGVIHFETEAELLGQSSILVDQDRKYRRDATGIARGFWGGLRRHRYQGSVGVGQKLSSFEQPAEIDVAVPAPGATIEDKNQRRVFVLRKMLA